MVAALTNHYNSILFSLSEKNTTVLPEPFKGHSMHIQ